MFRNLLIAIIFICNLAFAQHAPLPAVSTSTNSWLLQCSSRPAPLSLYAINKCVCIAIFDGTASELDRFFLFAQDVEANGLISIINPTSSAATKTGTPTWSTQGYTGSAGNYVRTNFVPSTDGVKYTTTGANYGGYVRTHTATSTCEFGTIQVKWAWFCASYGGTLISCTNSVNYFSTANADAKGFWASWVNGATIYIYKNGSSFTSSTAAGATASIDKQFYVCARNNNGVADSFSDKQVSLFYAGSSSIDNLKWYNNINILAYAMGFNY